MPTTNRSQERSATSHRGLPVAAVLLLAAVMTLTCWGDLALRITTCHAFAPPQPALLSSRHNFRSQKSMNDGSNILLLSTAEKSNKESVEVAAAEEEDDVLSEMPWSDLQSWALRDNLPKYVVAIPIPGSGSTTTLSNGSKHKKKQYGTYALWRTMLKETTELAGYEVEYVRRVYERDVKSRDDWKGYGIGSSQQGDEDSSEKAAAVSAPGVLPLLESFEFHPDGGVSGLAYGIPGIAGGTSIRTTAVSDIEKTVILGYVQTEDGSAAYELGSPAGDFYAVGAMMSEDARRTMLENVARLANSVVRTGTAGAGKLADAAAGGSTVGGEMDSTLVNLAGTTAIALAGATAVGMLSHHLTVNVFWV